MPPGKSPELLLMNLQLPPEFLICRHCAMCFVCITLFIAPISRHSPDRHFSPILEPRRLRLRDVFPLAQDHTARKHWSHESNPGFLTVPSTVNTHMQLEHTPHSPTTNLRPTPSPWAQGPFSFRPGCSGNTLRTAFRSRPTSLGKMRAPSLLPTTPGIPLSPTHAGPPTASLDSVALGLSVSLGMGPA